MAPDIKAENAFHVHSALAIAENLDGSLRDNPQWIALRKEVYERFERAFGEIK